MQRTSILSYISVFGGLGVILATGAHSQGGGVKNLVFLQGSTPGVTQAGHSNISGTARAGQFVGGGAGVTGVNAAQLGGLAANQYGVVNNNNSWIGLNTFSSAGNSFSGNGAGLHSLNASNIASGTLSAARLPNPLILSGTESNGVLQVTNTQAIPGMTAIRATGPLPIHAIGTAGSTEAVRVNAASGANGVTSFTNSGDGFYGQTATGRAVVGNSNGSGIGVSGFSAQGIGVYGRTFSASSSGVVAEGGGGANALETFGRTKMNGDLWLQNFNGISIGTNATPQFPIDFGENLGDKISLWGGSSSNHYGFGVQANQLQIFNDVITSFTSFGYGGSASFTEIARLSNQATFDFYPQGQDFAASYRAPYDTLFMKDVDSDSGDAWFRFFTDGFVWENIRINDGDEADAFFDGAVIANGIDFAEAFKTHESDLEPGDLVINSSSNWEYVSKSARPYQSGVIGVVSTKPAFVAGMSFDAEDRMNPELTRRRDQARRDKNMKLEKELTKQMRQLVEEAYKPVAFMGRVPVKVVGPVKVGDKLTASNVPGKAMAMHRSGHSIGIALESIGSGTGTVMAMIQPGQVTLEAPGTSFPELVGKVASTLAENVRLKAHVEELEARIERLEELVEKRLK